MKSMPAKLTKKEIARIRQLYADFLDSGRGDEADLIGLLIDPVLRLLNYTDRGGDHLLHVAAKQGDLMTVKSLLEAGVDVDRTGDMGCTALHYALSRDKKDVVDFLLARGASRTIRNDFGLFPGEKIR
ncbi:MAG: ankyrin repeat domain-containing protein [Candidatus Accumulibacter sp.]|jgi:ankyrin repeat protein|nr:ankyrin repeat domain-containing protein [Accumulibacter sp.]